MIFSDKNYTPFDADIMKGIEEGLIIADGEKPKLITKNITANGTYNSSSDNADGYNKVVANVANTYTVEDNGKVVSNQALVAQTAYPTEIIENDTYDTTNYNSITVNVSGGGSEPFIITVSGFDDGATVNKTSAEIIAAYNANPTDIIILIEGFQNNDYIIRDIAFDNSGSNMSLYGTISKVDRVDSTYQLTNSTFRLELYPNYVSVTYKSIRLDCNSSDDSVAVGNYTEFPT